mmetsp:Transcript_1677/g.3740  ORF Transcript_1677/g.3740 Transcript_1677/m.3740 type:complete len:145 (+) Transcript_1677:558-992(+)|eukprot:CAMPEP_0168204942 /NCGR_PEP_ID=MMETSP0140_2-20121125/104_1 /TAXON_ID=44445 /ORGANISM="Pseudo-nitzschia australis, Strain 10249 10 AB" /LENGTH=144 /DNA_ID=CAMNT_0008130907 /DNA_START=565 /DNA_END=999 /DNA_ORIENTATION=-
MVSKVSVFAFAKWLGKIIGFITETILSKARRANCVGLIAAPAKTACVGCVSLGTLATPTRWTNKTVLIARTAETSSTMPTFTLIATTKKTRAMDFTRGVQKIVILAKELVIIEIEAKIEEIIVIGKTKIEEIVVREEVIIEIEA